MIQRIYLIQVISFMLERLTHPYERYLKHFIGYQGRIKLVYHYGIALVNYEGPMKSSKRKSNYLRLNGS